MKEISVSLWEITLEEALKLLPDTQVLVYYPLYETYMIHRARVLPRSLFIKEVVFFTFEEPRYSIVEADESEEQ